VNTQTRHALKQDGLVQATSSSVGWIQTHRDNVIRLSLAAVVVIAAVIAGILIYNQRSAASQVAFGQAVETYTTPLKQPGAPADPGQPTFATSTDRAKAANPQFLAVADKYGMLEAGRNARYFAGLSYMDLGNKSAAESELKQVANGHDSNVGSLAKSALAGLYHQTGRDEEAIKLYQELIAKPTDTVPAPAAKLQLAELYEATKPAEARKLYAELEDKEKTTAAGQIAAEKLKGPGK
jgi:tetratricopeptide (TPR) repeat protein